MGLEGRGWACSRDGGPERVDTGWIRKKIGGLFLDTFREALVPTGPREHH